MRRLRENKADVTAASRTGAAPSGCRGATFDWYDASTHAAALDAAIGMYLIPPPSDPEPAAVMLPFIEQARNAGVRRVVLHSNIVVPAGGPGIGLVHQALPSLIQEWAVLRPSWFMQNITGKHPQARSLRADSSLTSATGNGRVGFVDAGDIAGVAAHLLMAGNAVNDELILTGPEALSYSDVASILSHATGKTIPHITLDAPTLKARYEAMGVPPAATQVLTTMDSLVASGQVATVTDAVQRTTGVRPRSYTDFASAEFRW